MNLNIFLSIAVAWLDFDVLTNCLCVVLVLAIFAITRNTFSQSR